MGDRNMVGAEKHMVRQSNMGEHKNTWLEKAKWRRGNQYREAKKHGRSKEA